ncbi:hypothetical protein [Pseudomonas laurentiana]|uniref:Lipoprotein n=1 Tax=Pseudomonas laurentiana TaxID=2364649 RepID=A0A6I5RPV2_9PSED|nr:hypothetical protein [Pseudomonas laurentiana]NES10194.1 hypothetical protein [Pseudomonas laurentiana]
MRYRNIAIATLLLTMAGCSDSPDTKEAMTCLAAVGVLQNLQALAGISHYLQSNEKDFDGLSEKEAIKIAMDVRKEYGLDTMTTAQARNVYVKIYNASYCRAMHGQDEM